jgi:hypothetical protein
MLRMARRKVRPEASPDIEIRLPDGRIIAIEVKGLSNGIAVSDAMSQAAMHVGGASAAAVGAASMLGWYVRSDAPWLRGDDAAIRSDWVTVGDDLWRATGGITRSIEDNDDQPHLFDPSEYVKTER